MVLSPSWRTPFDFFPAEFVSGKFFGRCFVSYLFKSRFSLIFSAESAELGINLQIFNKSADFLSQKVIFSTEIAKRACRVVYRREHLRKLRGRAQNTSASKS